MDAPSAYQRLNQVFSRAAPRYDPVILSNFVNRGIRDVEVGTLLPLAKDSKSILEVGCGTGQEASRVLAATHADLVGIDVAEGMIDFARLKLTTRGFSSRIQMRVLPAAHVDELAQEFDLVYSFNGALNTEPDLPGFFAGAGKVTHPGAFLVISLRTRPCFGETVLYRWLGKRSELARRRAPQVQVEVVGEPVESRYYTVPELLEKVPRNFRLVSLTGLAVVLPPYLAPRVKGTVLQRLVREANRIAGRLPWLKVLGDETLFVFQRV